MDPDNAYISFNDLIEKYPIPDYNEADTRAKIIDKIIIDCLGWTEDDIQRETYNDAGFIDYGIHLNNNPILVIEAKKSGEYFEVPATNSNRNYKIGGIISTIDNLKAAIDQVQRYCVEIGCKYAAVFNGHQMILFTAITVGKPWREGNCLIFHSFADIKENFMFFWNILSRENVINGSLGLNLESSRKKLSYTKIMDLFTTVHNTYARNKLYTFIRPISELIFSELLDDSRIEILRECYVYGRSSNPEMTEMEQYFVDKVPHHLAECFKIKDIIESAKKAGIFQQELEKTRKDSVGDLIVLLGGIGAGKSTFLNRFFKLLLKDRENLLWFYIDFRQSSVDANTIEDFILSKIKDKWKNEYLKIFIGILNDYGFTVDENDKKKYFVSLFNLLHKLGFSISLVIDNVDQHDTNFQEKIFIEANHLKETLKTLTIIALRESTFMISSSMGVFDAYTFPKFHIASPNFLTVIIKRIEFTLKKLEQKDPGFFPDLNASDRDNIVKYFKILVASLSRSNQQSTMIVNFIDSISVGNMRDALEMYSNFIISGNTNIDEIFTKYEQSKSYQIAYHQFIKAIILGEHKFYSQDNSKIMNVFDFDYSLGDSHFTQLRILKYLEDNLNKSTRIGRGYVLINKLVQEADNVSINKSIIIDSLLRLARFNLIEFDNQSKDRVTTAEYVKITYSGKYYLNFLIYEFVYLDSVFIDTPLSDQKLVQDLKRLVNEVDLGTRLKRTRMFVDYLVEAEETEFKERPEYTSSSFTNTHFTAGINQKYSIREKWLLENKTIQNL